MKKMINTSFFYAIAALVGGVFYREFTKFQGFTGKTTLSVVHTHLFLLGMCFFLLVTLLMKQFAIREDKRFSLFYGIYNGGIAVTTVAFLWRGVLQVNGTVLSKAMDASISGVAGIGHVLISVGLVLFFLMLKKSLVKEHEHAHF